MAASNLIVNYLPPDLDEPEMHTLFQEFGKVLSAKVVKNKATGASMCYGFVVMEEPDEAAAAISGLNQKPVRGKVLRVGLAKPKNGENRDATNTNLYITGINDATTEENLDGVFGQYGEIVSSRVVQSKSSPNKAVAFVNFVKREDAERALENLNGQVLCIKDCPEGSCACVDKISVRFSLSPSKSALRHNPNVPMGNPYQMGVQFAYPMAPNCFRPPYNPSYEVSTTLPNYGYASGHLQTLMPQNVTATRFNNAAIQQANQYANYYNALAYANPHPPQYTPNPSPYPPPVPPPTVTGLTPGSLAQLATGGHCVFVYGLSQATTEEELLALFLPFGAVSNCRVCYETAEGKRSCKGYGFVNFYSYNDAQLAITSINNFNYKGRTLQVRFKSSKESS